MKMRRAAVAGAFYEREKSSLEKRLEECFSGVTREENENIIGAVVPHAGYMYSGGVAANVYAKLPGADTFVILGPNHQGMGSLIAVSVDTWVTPLGEVEVDKAFVDALPKRIIDVDETAHKYEHSIEVQLPFLQFRFDKNFLFVPVCMSLNDEDTTREIGEDLANTIAKFGKKVVVIASSDFTHYEPDRIAREKDEYVIEAIKELDVAKFYNRVYERNSTACGVGPIAAMMQAAKKLGAREGKLIKYATSGDVIGDTSRVVGYGGIIIF
ncbi:MAG: MEMO1 family protein [Candidatus Syntrophoarchaeum sp.]|nr:MEMO1 family protein [Candidatus Syntrophoarchaeum sp.]